MHPQAFMDTKTAARRLGVSKGTVAYMAKTGRLPVAFRGGAGPNGSMFYPAEAVEQLRAERAAALAEQLRELSEPASRE